MCVCGALCRVYLQMFSCSCAAELRQAEHGPRALGAKPRAPPRPRAFILMGSPAQRCARRAGHGLSAAPSRAAAGEPGRGEGAAAQAPPAGRGARAAALAGARRCARGRAGPAERGGRVQLLPERGRAVPVALRRVPGGPAAPAARRAGGAPPGPPGQDPPASVPCLCRASCCSCDRNQSSVTFAVLHSQRVMLCGKSCTCLLLPPAAATAAVRPGQETERLSLGCVAPYLAGLLDLTQPSVAAPRTGQRGDGGPARAVQRVCAAGGRPQRRRRRAAPSRGPYAAARGPGGVQRRVLQPGHALPGPMGSHRTLRRAKLLLWPAAQWGVPVRPAPARACSLDSWPLSAQLAGSCGRTPGTHDKQLCKACP